MKNYYNNINIPNGYTETIQKGLNAVRYFSPGVSYGKGTYDENILKLENNIKNADAIVIGAGAGLSTSAGYVYNGERFQKYFFDFAKRFGITDMYSGGFFPFSKKEIMWAWWARHIYFNRYVDDPKPVYKNLLEIIKNKDYFVITTNADHCFQKAGFDKKRLFYTQGDYGLFQSMNSNDNNTYDNKEWVEKAMAAQGFVKNKNNFFDVPENKKISMEIPTELIPHTPDGSDVTMNLRSDDSFVEDKGWHRASAVYSDFLRRHEGLHILYMEIGVGSNTPVIIKYPFWQMTRDNPNAIYACLNYGEAYCPKEIEKQSICINGDTGDILKKIKI